MFDFHKGHKTGEEPVSVPGARGSGHPGAEEHKSEDHPALENPALTRASDPFRGKTPLPNQVEPMPRTLEPVKESPPAAGMPEPREGDDPAGYEAPLPRAGAPPLVGAKAGLTPTLASVPASFPSTPAPPQDFPSAWAAAPDAERNGLPDGALPQHAGGSVGAGPGVPPSSFGPIAPPHSPAGPPPPSSHLGEPFAEGRPDPHAPHLTEGLKLLERLVHLVRDRKGTDIHMVEGERPRIRLRGDLIPLEAKDHPVVTHRDIQDVLDFGLTPEQRAIFEKEHDVDFSLDFRDAMGRVNVGMANGRRLQLVIRYLPSNFIPLDNLGIDAPMLKSMIDTGSGLVIVTGETSSGKTTTIIAMLDYINHTRFGAILTIENPVEYAMRSDKCLITRREVGRDTPSFHTALRASVRKNPDVLLIGEIRDYESGSIALSASETGIQTFCTLHAVGAIPALTRLGNIMVGGGHDEEAFFNRLANVLRGIISQQLVKAVDGKGVVPLYEILNVTYSEKRYLRERDFARLENSLESERNISIGECVYRLWQRDPRPIDETIVRQVFGDQYKLAINHLQDKSGWKPLVSAMG